MEFERIIVRRLCIQLGSEHEETLTCEELHAMLVKGCPY